MHLLHELAGDVQSQPGAALAPRRLGIRLGEAPEDARPEFLRDTFAAVAYLDAHRAVTQLRTDVDLAAGGGKLRRVGQQVGQRLHHPARVHVHGDPGIDGLDHDGCIVFVRQRRAGLHRQGDEIGERFIAQLEVRLPGRHLFQVMDLVHERHQPLAVGA